MVKRILFIFAVALSTVNQFSTAATVPAQTFSRANCTFAWPGMGSGYFNESISYDALTGSHNMSATTSQIANNSNTRGKTGYQPNGYRAYAGYTDPFSDTRKWTVSGSHYEVLNNGSVVRSNSRATTCNIDISQFL
ncbi:hypothetical protein [Acinetobacter calcoaceticus]|jgi:hypothetical protein|uniref:hypothetical protein n=1 Tax=Acinetobacter calcoaceticus TaxID=471 RepID=UPI001AEA7F77|nr:hypothetical protein [Acinetobacter calcoaceticus]MBP2604533.1 hypothetical protein [Acinetobacter calcoaceticus]